MLVKCETCLQFYPSTVVHVCHAVEPMITWYQVWVEFGKGEGESTFMQATQGLLNAREISAAFWERYELNKSYWPIKPRRTIIRRCNEIRG